MITLFFIMSVPWSLLFLDEGAGRAWSQGDRSSIARSLIGTSRKKRDRNKLMFTQDNESDRQVSSLPRLTVTIIRSALMRSPLTEEKKPRSRNSYPVWMEVERKTRIKPVLFLLEAHEPQLIDERFNKEKNVWLSILSFLWFNLHTFSVSWFLSLVFFWGSLWLINMMAPKNTLASS